MLSNSIQGTAPKQQLFAWKKPGYGVNSDNWNNMLSVEQEELHVLLLSVKHIPLWNICW